MASKELPEYDGTPLKFQHLESGSRTEFQVSLGYIPRHNLKKKGIQHVKVHTIPGWNRSLPKGRLFLGLFLEENST